jgi:hypothetical protein
VRFLKYVKRKEGKTRDPELEGQHNNKCLPNQKKERKKENKRKRKKVSNLDSGFLDFQSSKITQVNCYMNVAGILATLPGKPGNIGNSITWEC